MNESAFVVKVRARTSTVLITRIWFVLARDAEEAKRHIEALGEFLVEEVFTVEEYLKRRECQGIMVRTEDILYRRTSGT